MSELTSDDALLDGGGTTGNGGQPSGGPRTITSSLNAADDMKKQTEKAVAKDTKSRDIASET